MLGEITSLLSHQVYKKGYKPDERWIHLKRGTPEHLEDETVLKAKKAIEETKLHNGDFDEDKLTFVLTKIQEQIDIELEDEVRNAYRINQLKKLIEG